MANNDWKVTSLGDLIDIKHGFAFLGEYFTDKVTPNVLLTPGNFAIGGGFQGNKYKYYFGEIPEDYVLNFNDLIVTMTDLSKNMDTLGYPAFVPEDSSRRFLHNQRLGKVIIKCDDRLDKHFLYYLLCTKNYHSEIQATSSGSVIHHTSPQRIVNYTFPLPPLPEQRAIADVLSALDDKIDLNRRMNATLESLAQALFKHMFIDNPEREIWEVGSLGDDFNLTMGQSPPGSTYNEIGTGLPFFQGRADFGLRYPSNRVYCTAPTRFADTGDTLVCVRAPVGDVNVAFEKCAIGRGLAAIRHKSGSRSYTFYMMQFLEPEFKNFELEGTVFGSINKDSFLSLKIPLPPHNLIEKFEEICYPVDQKIELNNRESRNLAELRDTLLPKLMSGQVQVNHGRGDS